MRTSFIILLLILILSTASYASSSVVFTRDTLFIEADVIVPAAATSVSDALNAEQSDAERNTGDEDAETEIMQVKHQLYVVIRDAEAYETDWIIDNTETRDNFGILYMFDQPTATALSPSENEITHDIFFIGSYGEVKTIAKEIAPINLAEPLTVNIPVKALLYTQGGYADRNNITPGARVIHSLFPKKPTVVSEQ